MQLLRLISLLFATQLIAAESFTTKQCIDKKFSVTLSHKGKFFGYPEHHFNISKDLCTIKVSYKTLFEKSWEVDVCREPIHIKQIDKGSLTVIKMKKNCEKSMDSDFCKEANELLELIQDHGLIFAKGVKENINTDLGVIYCSYLLMHQYLIKANIFSVYKKNKDLLNIIDETENCKLPPVESKVETLKGPPINLVPKRIPIQEEVKTETVQPESEVTEESSEPRF
jgi:hypothetical protein